MEYSTSLGKQGQRVYTISLERRVYTTEASDPRKRKKRDSMVVVYAFFYASLAKKKSQQTTKIGGTHLPNLDRERGNHAVVIVL